MLNIPGTQGALPSRLFSLLIHDALDAVLIIDDLGSIQYANPAFEALCGYTAQEIRGQSLNGLLPDQIARHHDQYLKNYLTGTTPSPVLRKVREMQLRHRTGEIIPIEMKAVDVGVIEGHRYLAAFMTDIRSRKRLEAQNAVYVMQLRQLALTDALTGLPNRRSFEDEAARSFARARREGHAISLAVADIDHFKAVNDTYGHHIGDMVLKTFAAALKEGLRSSDFVGRTGGEIAANSACCFHARTSMKH